MIGGRESGVGEVEDRTTILDPRTSTLDHFEEIEYLISMPSTNSAVICWSPRE